MDLHDAGSRPRKAGTKAIVEADGSIWGTIGGGPVTPDTYIALVSRGHLVDSNALAACIHRPAAYVGMMGRRRKVALVRRQFIESGLATAEQFDRVHAPIGLHIGAETVPEIAASIVAQLIEVRRRKASPTPRHAEEAG